MFAVENVRKSLRITHKQIRTEIRDFSRETFTCSVNFIRFMMEACVKVGYTIPNILSMRLISRAYREAIDPILAELLNDYNFEDGHLFLKKPIKDDGWICYNYAWRLIIQIIEISRKKGIYHNLNLLLAKKYFKVSDIPNFIDLIVPHLNAHKKVISIFDVICNNPMYQNQRLLDTLYIFGGGYVTRNGVTFGFLLYNHRFQCQHLRIMLKDDYTLDQLNYEVLNEMLACSLVPINNSLGMGLTFGQDDTLFWGGDCTSSRLHNENEYTINSNGYHPVIDDSKLIDYRFNENITEPF